MLPFAYIVQDHHIMIPPPPRPQHTHKLTLESNTAQFHNCTNGETRLMDGSSPNKGRLEVCLDSTWATVCGSGFNIREGVVTCKQLGYQRYGILDSTVV